MTRQTLEPATSRLTTSAYIAFIAFGSFWGVWGASIPRVQARAGVTAGQLGLALLFVGLGALPAMALIGAALDRWGLRCAYLAVAALGVTGAVAVCAARDLLSLCAGLSLVGATSGSADVAINAIVGRAGKRAGRVVIARAHGAFSVAVVTSSLATGLVSATPLPPFTPFVAAAAVCVGAGLYMAAKLPGRSPRDAARFRKVESAAGSDSTAAHLRVTPLVLIGVLGAFALASENAYQSWAAVFVRSELHTDAAHAAITPAVFAGTVAIARLSMGRLGLVSGRATLTAGGIAGATGAAIIACADSLLVAAVGLVVVGAGTAVLSPTLLAIVSQNVDEIHRGRATSIVTSVSYLGFLLGPVYVGALAAAGGLRVAFVAVAALSVALLILAPVLLRISGYDYVSARDRQAVACVS